MRQLKITKQLTKREDSSLDKYLSDVSKIKLLSANEEADLARLSRNGDKRALDKLIKTNLRFVVSVAKQYQGQGMPLSDLIEEGNVGLIKAVERYDETRGFKFISYAVWWIRQSILSALAEHSRVIRLPLNKISQITKIVKVYSELEQQLQRSPTAEEIGEVLEMPVADIKQLIVISGRSISLDAPLSENDNLSSSLYDLIGSNKVETPEEKLLHQSLQKEINRSLSTLPKHEEEIIKLFYGLDGFKQMSLNEIGIKFNLSRERIRQIRDNGIRRLRYISRNKLLKSYL